MERIRSQVDPQTVLIFTVLIGLWNLISPSVCHAQVRSTERSWLSRFCDSATCDWKRSLKETEFQNQPSAETAGKLAKHLLWRAKQAAEHNKQIAVDHAYLAATYAWYGQFALEPSPCVGSQCLRIYNEAVGVCLEVGFKTGRFHPTKGLTVSTPMGWQTVPVEIFGLEWQPGKIDRLYAVADVPVDDINSDYKVDGVGAPMAAVHVRDPSDPTEEYLFDEHVYALTIVLRPDLRWLVGSNELLGTSEKDHSPLGPAVELHDVLRHSGVRVAENVWPLTKHAAVALTMSRKLARGEHNVVRAYLHPDRAIDQQRLYMLEPHKPGRIPIIMVHGFLSYPWTWTEIANFIRSDPWMMEHFELWTYFYPTSMPVPQSSANLRSKMRRAVEEFDPEGTDVALQNMVMLGHSMGGLITKMQITDSGSTLWNRFSNVPWPQVRGSEKMKRFFHRQFFYEAQPFITRAVFFATPHRGTGLPEAGVRCIALALAGELRTTTQYFQELVQKNPGIIREPDLTRYGNGPLIRILRSPFFIPSSILNVTEPSSVLQGLDQLPYNPRVTIHTVYGRLGEFCDREIGDLVVPPYSAREPETDTLRALRITHGRVHRIPAALQETQQILLQQWEAVQAARAATPIAPTPSDETRQDVPAPLPSEFDDRESVEFDASPVPAPAPLGYD
ncbi:esterase/lipase family protein [Thalassoroseus pseudoceratinae]|uniref:esterase/lipase family protein n=1 Tax=Thalassoroseus pseudoceratinae TaxID=2713176 RepID=UPI0014231C0B|nr:hypothetical protein [Thalassoroseus pseudoceratinae]